MTEKKTTEIAEMEGSTIQAPVVCVQMCVQERRARAKHKPIIVTLFDRRIFRNGREVSVLSVHGCTDYFF